MFIYLKKVYYLYKERNENNNLNNQFIFNCKKILLLFSIQKFFILMK